MCAYFVGYDVCDIGLSDKRLTAVAHFINMEKRLSQHG